LQLFFIGKENQSIIAIICQDPIPITIPINCQLLNWQSIISHLCIHILLWQNHQHTHTDSSKIHTKTTMQCIYITARVYYSPHSSTCNIMCISLSHVHHTQISNVIHCHNLSSYFLPSTLVLFNNCIINPNKLCFCWAGCICLMLMRETNDSSIPHCDTCTGVVFAILVHSMRRIDKPPCTVLVINR